MYEALKEEISNILDVTNKCPDDLKKTCFETLLHAYIDEHKKDHGLSKHNSQPDYPTATIEEAIGMNGKTSNDDIKPSIFHVVIRKMLESNNVTMDELNTLYYVDGNAIKPLFDTLKTSTMRDSQIRLTLLTAFENGFASNDLVADIEIVREKCKVFKSYDKSNFSAIFKRSKELFDNYDESSLKMLRLSAEGKKALTVAIHEMAKGA